MNKKEKNAIRSGKGITLIALVVTIIVLIILAGVSINLVLGDNGIITRAKQAKQNTELAQIEEQVAINEAVAYLDNLGTGTSTGEETEPETENFPYLADEVSVGDYVAYDATNNYSYKSPIGTGLAHGNGYAEQTFTSSSDIKWRVLSTDTTTKEVVLISEGPIQTDAGADFYMKGAIGYLYGEQELNEICKIYGHGEGANTTKTFTYETGDVIEGTTTGTITGSGARSFSLADINTITGYTPSAGTSYTNTIFYPTKQTETGISASAVSRTYEDTAYNYNGSTYLSGTIYDMLFNQDIDANWQYWLASRAIMPYSTGVTFDVRVIWSDKVSGWEIFHVSEESGAGTDDFAGVRPIVYLKTTVQTSGKNDDGQWIIK